MIIFNDVLTSADIENQIIYKPTSTLKIEKNKLKLKHNKNSQHPSEKSLCTETLKTTSNYETMQTN